jgi:hypothetical protein
MPGIDVFGDSDYTYVQVASAIAARIESGELERKLPAEPELAKQYGHGPHRAQRERVPSLYDSRILARSPS